jgi:hypothetical protein
MAITISPRCRVHSRMRPLATCSQPPPPAASPGRDADLASASRSGGQKRSGGTVGYHSPGSSSSSGCSSEIAAGHVTAIVVRFARRSAVLVRACVRKCRTNSGSCPWTDVFPVVPAFRAIAVIAEAFALRSGCRDPCPAVVGPSARGMGRSLKNTSSAAVAYSSQCPPAGGLP